MKIFLGVIIIALSTMAQAYEFYYCRHENISAYFTNVNMSPTLHFYDDGKGFKITAPPRKKHLKYNPKLCSTDFGYLFSGLIKKSNRYSAFHIEVYTKTPLHLEIKLVTRVSDGESPRVMYFNLPCKPY